MIFEHKVNGSQKEWVEAGEIDRKFSICKQTRLANKFMSNTQV